MPTADEFWPVAARVISERGYLVIGLPKRVAPLTLGSTVHELAGFKSDRPLVVVGFTNWWDWKEQMETIYRLQPAWGRTAEHIDYTDGWYYRVKFWEAN